MHFTHEDAAIERCAYSFAAHGEGALERCAYSHARRACILVGLDGAGSLAEDLRQLDLVAVFTPLRNKLLRVGTSLTCCGSILFLRGVGGRRVLSFLLMAL